MALAASDHPADGPRDDARDATAEPMQQSTMPLTSDDGASSQHPSQHGSDRAARGYSWPPFQPGHTLSMVHGATSPRAIADRAEQVHAELLAVVPYLAEPKFAPAVARYLAAAAREALLHEHIQAVSAERGAGKVPARMWEQATAATRLAAKLGSDLGLDPIGHARIRALSAGAEATEATLADLVAEGRTIRARAEERRRQAALDAAEPLEAAETTEGPDGDDSGQEAL